MAPLSILPGRVRFEDRRLIGNGALSRHIEAKLCGTDGVNLVSVSHRTGRILVQFSEERISRDNLTHIIREMFSIDPSLMESKNKAMTAIPEKTSGLFRGQILADMALHMLLPAPFDLLLPAVGSAFRRGQPIAVTP
ncbi:MAG: hypothetical protein A2079_08260 [Geobacteraceae bacterium GWC2_48_7]|nr:MAG: hypothetical protein A2079_08260 [Geobacteraceae bacterium GWC2_48_7]